LPSSKLKHQTSHLGAFPDRNPLVKQWSELAGICSSAIAPRAAAPSAASTTVRPVHMHYSNKLHPWRLAPKCLRHPNGERLVLMKLF